MSATAEAETTLSEQAEVKKDTTKELWATLKCIDSLHPLCDWLVNFVDVRKTAKTGQSDALVNAKKVLSGCD